MFGSPQVAKWQYDICPHGKVKVLAKISPSQGWSAPLSCTLPPWWGQWLVFWRSGVAAGRTWTPCSHLRSCREVWCELFAIGLCEQPHNADYYWSFYAPFAKKHSKILICRPTEVDLTEIKRQLSYKMVNSSAVLTCWSRADRMSEDSVDKVCSS